MPLLLIQVQVIKLVQGMHRAVDPHPDEARFTGRFEHLAVLALLAPHFGCQEQDPAAFGQGHDGVDDLLDRLPFNRPAALGAVGMADAGEQQAQVIVDLGDGAHGGAGVVGNPLLVDGDSRREPFDIVHVGLVHSAQKLAGVCGKRLDVAALSLGIDGVKGQGALTRTGHAGDNNQLAPGDGDVDVLEVVLPGPFYNDEILGHNLPPETL